MCTRSVLFCCLLAVAAPASIKASVAVPVEITTLVADAQVIVHGRIVRLEGRASADGLGIEIPKKTDDLNAACPLQQGLPVGRCRRPAVG